MSDDKVIEQHHYHDPSQGQVHKALYQYLHDQGVVGEKLQEIVQKKVDEAVNRQVDALLRTGSFDRMLVAAVCKVYLSEKALFDKDNNSYGWHNHIRDLVKAEIARLVLAEYTVSVTKNK